MRKVTKRLLAIVLSALMVVTALPMTIFAADSQWKVVASTDFTRNPTFTRGSNNHAGDIDGAWDYAGSNFTAKEGNVAATWNTVCWSTSNDPVVDSTGVMLADGYAYYPGGTTPITGAKSFKIVYNFDLSNCSQDMSNTNNALALIKLWKNVDAPGRSGQTGLGGEASNNNVFTQYLNLGRVYTDQGVIGTNVDIYPKRDGYNKYILEYDGDAHTLKGTMYKSDTEYVVLVDTTITIDTNSITSISLGDPDSTFLLNMKMKDITFYTSNVNAVTVNRTASYRYGNVVVGGSLNSRKGSYNNSFCLCRDNDSATTLGLWEFAAPDFNAEDCTVTRATLKANITHTETSNMPITIGFWAIPEGNLANSASGWEPCPIDGDNQGYTRTFSGRSFTLANNVLGLDDSNFIGSYTRNASTSATQNQPLSFTIPSANLKSALQSFAEAESSYVIVGYLLTDHDHSGGKWSDTWVNNVKIDYDLTYYSEEDDGEDFSIIGSSYVVNSQPFQTEKPSQIYRIPSLVSLDNGNLIAAADARWNGGMDGGGNDVVVARSVNNGATWGVDLVNYYGDNGNVFNKSSTGFCDSALATDGEDVWMISTFFPAGYAINAASAYNRPSSAAAFDNQGRLMLHRAGESGFNYYMDVNAKINGRYSIRRASDNSYAMNGSNYYTIDADFYLYNGNTKGSCIFYNDCDFDTVKAQFLFMRHSEDGGKTWDDVKLLNLRRSGETFFGIGPGRGIVTSDGTLVFTGYVWGGSDSSQRAYLFWSRDGGKTWTRSTNPVTNSVWNSESQPIELPNGKIRLFFRNGTNKICYADATFGNHYADVSWSDYVNTNIANSSNCQISAVMYPYTIGGKRAMIVSCPTTTDSAISGGHRRSGVMYTMLLNNDNSISYTYQKAMVNNGVQYEYSCMTVLPDGSIAILYETTDFVLKFEIVQPSSFGHGLNVAIPVKTKVNLAVGESVTYNVPSAPSAGYDTSVVGVSSTRMFTSTCVQGNKNNSSGSHQYFSGTAVNVDDALWTFEDVGEDSILQTRMGVKSYLVRSATNPSIYLNIYSNGYPCNNEPTNIALYSNPSNTKDIAFRQLEDNNNYRYLLFGRSGNWGQKYFDQFNRSKNDNPFSITSTWNGTTWGAGIGANLFRKAKPGETYSDRIPGYVRLENASEVESGEQYLIAYWSEAPSGTDAASRYFLLYPFIDNSKSDKLSQVAYVTGNTVDNGYSVTVTGSTVGKTTVNMGGTEYEFNVTNSAMVTGAVRYDPIIYTMGDSFTAFGSNISDGTVKGELKTEYVVAEGWYLDSIEVSKGASAAAVIPSKHTKGGKLTGTITTEHRNSTSAMDSITLKTKLIGPDGGTYLQEDRLWCKTNPVPAQSIANTNAWRENFGCGSVVSSIGIIGDEYSESSYEASIQHDDCGQGNSNTTIGARNTSNMVNMFKKDGATGSDSNATNEMLYLATDNKRGGWHSYGYRRAFTTTNFTVTTTIPRSPCAHYYYDKSTSHNPGMSKVRTSSGDTFYLDLYVNRARYRNESGNYVTSVNSVTLNSETTTGALRVLDGHGMSVSNNMWYFSSPLAMQTITLQGEKNGTGVVKGTYNLDITKTGNSQGARTVQTYNINVHVISKNAAREAYARALSNSTKLDNFEISKDQLDVLVSTEYTTSSWREYHEKLLEVESYLGDYRNTNGGNRAQNLNKAYANLTRRANFDELDRQLEAKYDLSQNARPPISEDGVQSYDYSTWQTFKNAYTNGDTLANVTYDTYVKRANCAGYTSGVHSTTKTTTQNNIDTYAALIRDNPEAPADPWAYIAARETYSTIDFDAYVENADAARQEIATADSDIFVKLDGIEYINRPIGQQNIVDGHTTTLMSDINATTNTIGKRFNVTFKKNGVTERSVSYQYGTQVIFALSTLIGITADQDAVYTVTYGPTDNQVVANIQRPENDRIALLVCTDIIVDVTVTDKAQSTIRVLDFFGNITHSFTVPADDAVLSADSKTLTVSGQVVVPRPSPTYQFTRWIRQVDDDGVIYYIQRGNRIGSNYSITADGGTVTRNNVVVGDDTSIEGLNSAYSVSANNGVTPIVWKMCVGGVGGKEYLASYQSSFNRFTSDADVLYTAVTDVSQLGALEADYGKPITYGDAYFSGDNNDKFTLSCFYSNAPDTKIIEAGALYTTDTSKMDYDTFLKGASGVNALKQAQTTPVSENNNGVVSQADKTYTVTKKDGKYINCAMRSYVCYQKRVTIGQWNSEVAFVAYGPIYRCKDGALSLVEQN